MNGCRQRIRIFIPPSRPRLRSSISSPNRSAGDTGTGITGAGTAATGAGTAATGVGATVIGAGVAGTGAAGTAVTGDMPLSVPDCHLLCVRLATAAQRQNWEEGRTMKILVASAFAICLSLAAVSGSRAMPLAPLDQAAS